MNNPTIICLAYAVYLLGVGIILAAAWYSEKLDPENDLPPSIWDEILPPARPAAAEPQPPAPGLYPLQAGLKT